MSVKEEFIPTRSSYKKGFIVILLLLSMYVFENSPISKYIDRFTFNYILKPILWIGLVFIIWSLPRIRPKGLLKLRSLVNFWSLSFAVAYIITTVLAGLIDALGKSPYSHSLKGIIINIVFVGSVLIGRELVRNYLINSFTKKENYKVFILIAILMTFTNISISRYMNIASYADLVKFIAQYVGPEFAQNLFLSYLVYLGGPVASITYIGTIQGFHWLSPILPDLKWITVGLIGILAPMFFMMSLQTIYKTASKQLKVRDKNKESPISWIVTSVISIGIIWFAVGVFPIYPSVIATGSMEPMIKPGDVILVNKVVDMEGINNLKVDDVIQFKRDNILITHRIIVVRNYDGEGLGFKTKGDNNSSVDSEIVKPEDVKGTIVYTVPKIGWLTLLIKSDKDIDMDKIEF